jgi:hypothetical protein
MTRSTVYEVPVLGVRSHPHPRRGGCLLEIASSLGGGPWTDNPLRVDPVLAALGRKVNDRTSDVGRPRLLALAPWLFTDHLVDRTRMPVVLGSLAGRRALAHADPVAAARVAAQLAQLAGGDGPSLSRWAAWKQRRRATALVQLAARAVAAGLDADERLFVLLLDAVNLARSMEDRPSVNVKVTSDGWPTTLPVRVEERIPDGSESRYLHCTAEIDRWPALLRQAWQLRAAELAASHRPVAAVIGEG